MKFKVRINFVFMPHQEDAIQVQKWCLICICKILTFARLSWVTYRNNDKFKSGMYTGALFSGNGIYFYHEEHEDIILFIVFV